MDRIGWKVVRERGLGGLEGEEGKGRGFLNMDIVQIEK